jgi:membrane protein implicated in regulation of membrane protease activity
MEWLSANVQWWHWVVMGILFVAAEIVVPSFVIIWLGIAAIIVGAVDWLMAPEFSTQLYLWTGLSVLLLFSWFGYFKKTWRSPVGQAEGEHAHIPGRITEKLGGSRYRAEFELPVLGDRRWVVESREALEPGDRVEVAKVYGQIVKVKKIPQQRSH